MFRRNGSQCVATFAIDEVRVLRKVAGEVVALLTDGFDHGDPVVDRLFPDIYPSRPESILDSVRAVDLTLTPDELLDLG